MRKNRKQGINDSVLDAMVLNELCVTSWCSFLWQILSTHFCSESRVGSDLESRGVVSLDELKVCLRQTRKALMSIAERASDFDVVECRCDT